MSKPHKHAEVIKAWADGAEIQVLNETLCFSTPWEDCNGENLVYHPDLKYRIKPEREFPKTSLSYHDLLEAYNKGIDVRYQNRFLQIANAAIKQYILDEEAKK